MGKDHVRFYLKLTNRNGLNVLFYERYALSLGKTERGCCNILTSFMNLRKCQMIESRLCFFACLSRDVIIRCKQYFVKFCIVTVCLWSTCILEHGTASNSSSYFFVLCSINLLVLQMTSSLVQYQITCTIITLCLVQHQITFTSNYFSPCAASYYM